MQITAKINEMHFDVRSRQTVVSLMTSDNASDIETFVGKDLTVDIKQKHKGRSTNANAYFWQMVGLLATALGADQWEVYLYLLKRYGQFVEIAIQAEAVDAMKQQWRETEVLGNDDMGLTHMLCFFGSHTYNTAEFSRLIEGTLSELKEMKVPIPASEDDIRRAVGEWQK